MSKILKIKNNVDDKDLWAHDHRIERVTKIWVLKFLFGRIFFIYKTWLLLIFYIFQLGDKFSKNWIQRIEIVNNSQILEFNSVKLKVWG